MFRYLAHSSAVWTAAAKDCVLLDNGLAVVTRPRRRSRRLLQKQTNLLQKRRLSYNTPPHRSSFYIYTDGSCVHNGSPFARAGVGVYFGRNDPRNVSKSIMETHSSAAELRAVQCALDYILDSTPFLEHTSNAPERSVETNLPMSIVRPKVFVIVTDCEYVIDYLTRICPILETNQWSKSIRNKELMQAVYWQYRALLPHVRLLKVKAHTGATDRHSTGNREAHLLAITAARNG